ncbi:MAG: YggS family pyridoxal phosphate-dependent enzyme [Leptolyngbyaceae bacterium]|nr:YggS family pyridoxal phosphate-dependent enzyme [Leptolyngbyaceae bacterium]
MIEFETLSIGDRCHAIRQQIPESVRLIAVTKMVSASAIHEAYQAGIRDFGESRVQEAIAKQTELQNYSDIDADSIQWHLIGHLQRNKARKAVQHFDWIHSVDSLKIAQALNQAAIDENQTPQVCLQVKMRPDPNKYGWDPEILREELPSLDQCTHLKIRGLMAIPPLGLSTDETLDYFHQVAELAASIQSMPLTHLSLQELSMGMSEDYAIAIQAGATMIRPGRILFGERT